MDVLTAAWQASEQPQVVPAQLHGPCARCGRQNVALVRTRAVVSKAFTGYDSWRDPCGAGLCPTCTWGYRTPQLRAAPHQVTARPTAMQRLEPHQLAAALAAALPADTAVIVPLRPGRKHLLPTAVWGRVTVEDAHLPWGADDATRLSAMHRLRALGFGSRMLAGPAPVWSVLRRLPRHWYGRVQHDWAVLEPWRDRPLWFELGVQASFAPAQQAA